MTLAQTKSDNAWNRVINKQTIPNVAQDFLLHQLSVDEAFTLLIHKLNEPHRTGEYRASIIERMTKEQQLKAYEMLSPEALKSVLEYYRAKKEAHKRTDFNRAVSLSNDATECYCDIIILADQISKYIQQLYDRLLESDIILSNDYKYKYSKWMYKLIDHRKVLNEYVLFLDRERIMPRMTQYLCHYEKEYYGHGSFTFYAQKAWNEKNLVQSPMEDSCYQAMFDILDDMEQAKVWAPLMMVALLTELILHSVNAYNDIVCKYDEELIREYKAVCATANDLNLFNAKPKKPSLYRVLDIRKFDAIILDTNSIFIKLIGANFVDKIRPFVRKDFDDYKAAIKDYTTIWTWMVPIINDIVRDYAYFFFTRAAIDVRDGKGIHDDVINDIRYLHQNFNVRDNLRKELKALGTYLPAKYDIEDLTEMVRNKITASPDRFPFITKTIDNLFTIRDDTDNFPYDEAFLKKFRDLNLSKPILL